MIKVIFAVYCVVIFTLAIICFMTVPFVLIVAVWTENDWLLNLATSEMIIMILGVISGFIIQILDSDGVFKNYRNK